MNGFDKDFVPFACIVCSTICFGMYFNDYLLGTAVFFGLISFRI